MTDYKKISMFLAVVVVVLLAVLVVRSNDSQQAAVLRGAPTTAKAVPNPKTLSTAGMSLNINGVPIGGTTYNNYTFAGAVTSGTFSNMNFTYSVPSTYSSCTTFAGSNFNGGPGTSGWASITPTIGATTTYMGTETLGASMGGDRIIYGLMCNLIAGGSESLYGAVEILP